jgi:2-amino-4-hydroxy-6-hydroxymethyldihydropteridine diphosphokinase
MDPAASPGHRGVCACIALGSNLGDREAHLAAAIAALRGLPSTEVDSISAVYETDPVGPPPQDPYLNAAVRVTTRLDPRDLLDRLHGIEESRGRPRSRVRSSPRTLDLDLLFYGGERIEEAGLVVPHPRLHERPFVLEPLRDVAAELVHPILAETVEELARRIRDPAGVRRTPLEAERRAARDGAD